MCCRSTGAIALGQVFLWIQGVRRASVGRRQFDQVPLIGDITAAHRGLRQLGCVLAIESGPAAPGDVVRATPSDDG